MNYTTIYANFLKRFISPKHPLMVVFDCSNGTTGLVIKKLFKTHQLINYNPDGNFPAHGPNPLKNGAADELQRTVLREKADLGIIFDADGDRVFFIDNRGRFVDPDVIARLLIWHLKPKKITIGVRTGYLIKKSQIQNPKFQILISRTGHYFFKKLMRRKNADFGAERSGHYYFPASAGKKFYFSSGILAAIETINAVSRLPYALADFADLLPQYYRSGEIIFKSQISSVKFKKLLKKVESNLKTENHQLKIRVSRLDGLTMEFNPSMGSGWRFNLRSSNTEPLIRLNIEAKNKNVLQKEKKGLMLQLRSASILESSNN